MNRTMLGVAAVLGLLLTWYLAFGSLLGPPEPAAGRIQPGLTLDGLYGRLSVAEDDPRWNCRVQGNQICGPTQAAAGER